MKTILAILLILAALVFSSPAWSASLTLTTLEQHAMGDLRVITGTAAVDSGDTLAVGLNQITNVIVFARSPAKTVPNISHSVSGTTVTFYTSVNGLTWEFFIVGR